MSNQLLTKKVVKKALIGATFLATSPAWAKGGGGDAAGGKNQLGVNHLSLDETPGQNAIVCTSQEGIATKTGTNIMPNDLTIAVDPFEDSFIEIVFTVRDVLAHDKNQVLFLVYSPQITPPGSPEIPTPKSKKELRLVMAPLEILAMYEIPAQQMLYQDESRLGRANPAPHSELSFSVNLDTSVLPRFMDDNEVAYLQAALMSQEDYNAGNFDKMILSELDTIGFIKNECPPEYSYAGLDGSGTLTIVDYERNVTKTTQTTSMETGATTITGKLGGN